MERDKSIYKKNLNLGFDGISSFNSNYTKVVSISEKNGLISKRSSLEIKDNSCKKKREKNYFETFIVQKENNFFNYFKYLKNILRLIFMNEKIKKKDYEKCCDFQKKILKLILIQKFKLSDKDFVFFKKDSLDLDIPFSFETIENISQLTSKKRKNEVFEYIINQYIKNGLKKFKDELKIKKKIIDCLQIKIQFFKKEFGITTLNKEYLKTIISTFFKLKDNPKNKNYFKDFKKYSKNFKYMNMLELLKFNSIQKEKFLLFLDADTKINIFFCCKNQIASKIESYMENLNNEFSEKYGKNQEEFFTFLKKKIHKNSKTKFPMTIVDIKKYLRDLIKKL